MRNGENPYTPVGSLIVVRDIAAKYDARIGDKVHELYYIWLTINIANNHHSHTNNCLHQKGRYTTKINGSTRESGRTD